MKNPQTKTLHISTQTTLRCILKREKKTFPRKISESNPIASTSYNE